MKRNISLVGAALLLTVWVAGCASTGLERKDAASSSLTGLRDSMMETRGQIEQTLASLNGLTSASPDELRAAFEQYAKDADKIGQQAITVDEESRRMRSRSDEWFAGWKKTQGDVNNPELKALSERRREQALERFQNIDGSFAAAREAFAPFIANLQDVRRVIGADLTPNGVAAVSGTDVVRNANENGAAAARALDVTIADLDVLMQTLAPPSASLR